MEAAASAVPVPQIHAIGSWREHPALLIAWCPGRLLADELAARPWRAWALGVEFGRVQAAIHALPVPAALRDHPVPWEAWAGPDAALRERLEAIRPRPAVLLHLDYHPLNVLVDGGRVAGVLDWANARAGDPRADLARTASILRLAPLPGGAAGRAAWAVRRVLAAGWRRGYRQDAGSADEMAPFYAWAGAVMERDLAPRVGRPDLPWLTPAYLARVHRWAVAWQARAGVARYRREPR